MLIDLRTLQVFFAKFNLLSIIIPSNLKSFNDLHLLIVYHNKFWSLYRSFVGDEHKFRFFPVYIKFVVIASSCSIKISSDAYCLYNFYFNFDQKFFFFNFKSFEKILEKASFNFFKF